MKTGQTAPIEFEKLLMVLDGEPQVLDAAHALLEQKRNAPELGLAPAMPILNAFIESELDKAPVEVPKKAAMHIRRGAAQQPFLRCDS